MVENDSDRPIGRVRVTCLLQYEDHVPRSFVFEWTFIPALGRQWALDDLEDADVLGAEITTAVVTFTDASGHSWSRTSDGALHELRKNPRKGRRLHALPTELRRTF